VKGGIRYGGKY